MDDSKKTLERITKDLEKVKLKIRNEIEAITGDIYFTFIDYKGKEKPCNEYTKELLEL